uniref:Ubiquitin thioesterase OTU n=1 Tax=Chromera velia CCMP2878 TaxID=1169474 RepID=A0A0G4HAF8_9ALVE|eukprot:Cvel_25508.t1-p1 / transcript=Cvel_25508.t1 / gene=Cvel_25508 / organism=Chromera_velia_CCMP2878 / gene_product=Ubiquitin thioesterase OTU1, putative / transcript_product=Ubiquitin thioesterase OTU1, putative / location=Cvel_scaffold2902:11226-12688(-) / protein_length=311 / sequence_SO=supercontig / SO=protein_coding / is_pseudo=false
MRFLVKFEGKRNQIRLQKEEPPTWGNLKKQVEQEVGVSFSNVVLRFGFPPQNVERATDDSTLLEKVGISDGEALTLERAAEMVQPRASSQQVSQGAWKPSEHKTFTSLPSPEMLSSVDRFVIPSDNSCLFNCIVKTVDPSKTPAKLREIATQVIRADPEKYSEVVLGKPVDEYCAWLQRPESWGGFIELAIFSEYFGVCFAVFDVESCRIDYYGEESKAMVLFLYDGIHYDCFVGREKESGREAAVFSRDPMDDVSIAKALMITQDLHERKQFTNTAGMSLRCLVCQIPLKGEKEAVGHARETGHSNFSQC